MTTAHGKPKENWIQAVRIVRDIPLEDYRKKGDGRKWKALCVQRQRLMSLLATFADPDGSNIKVGVDRLAATLGWARRTVFNILDDLAEMGLIINDKNYSEYHGTRLRSINPDWLKLQKHISVVYRNNRKLYEALFDVKWAWEK